ncbi:MAG: sigma-70 family RNA polymerase sigma factor [Chloroflexi bacterium]|nr:sigma-70 family RNA polymerase sigma factor [Chloroflexota bacterium]
MAADVAERGVLERAKALDTRALERIYDQYSDRIYRYIYHRVGDPDVAEDLTALTFTKMLEAIHSGKEWRTSFSGWLYRIAHNVVVDHYRKKGRAQQVSLDTGLPLRAEKADPFQAAAKSLQVEALREAINQLTPEQADVIVMRFLEGYSIAEVAERLGKTEGAVKALQFRAIERLRRLMKDAA